MKQTALNSFVACNVFVILLISNKSCLYSYWSKDLGSVLDKRVEQGGSQRTTSKSDSSTRHDREGLKITNLSEAVGCETKTSFPSNKSTMASCCVSLNFSIWERSNTHFPEEENSSALISAMLDRQVTELTNHREACSIWAGFSVIGQEIQWVDQWSSRGVGQGTRAHKTAGNRAYCGSGSSQSILRDILHLYRCSYVLCGRHVFWRNRIYWANHIMGSI